MYVYVRIFPWRAHPLTLENSTIIPPEIFHETNNSEIVSNSTIQLHCVKNSKFDWVEPHDFDDGGDGIRCHLPKLTPRASGSKKLINKRLGSFHYHSNNSILHQYLEIYRIRLSWTESKVLSSMDSLDSNRNSCLIGIHLRPPCPNLFLLRSLFVWLLGNGEEDIWLLVAVCRVSCGVVERRNWLSPAGTGTLDGRLDSFSAIDCKWKVRTKSRTRRRCNVASTSHDTVSRAREILALNSTFYVVSTEDWSGTVVWFRSLVSTHWINYRGCAVNSRLCTTPRATVSVWDAFDIPGARDRGCDGACVENVTISKEES